MAALVDGGAQLRVVRERAQQADNVADRAEGLLDRAHVIGVGLLELCCHLVQVAP